MKYYFITYQATNKQGCKSIWNQAINVSPMDFIKDVESLEDKTNPVYRSYVVINTCEISKQEYEKYKDEF